MGRKMERVCRDFPGLALAALGLILSGPGCTDPASSMPYTFIRPLAMAPVCRVVKGGSVSALPWDECDEDSPTHEIIAFVADGPSGDIGLMNLSTGEPADVDPMVPGNTGLHVGTYLVDIAAAPDSKKVYAIDTVEKSLVVLDALTLDYSTVELPYSPGRLIYFAAQKTLLVTFPAQSSLGRIPLDQKGMPGDPEVVKVGGSPNSLSADDAGKLVVVGHLKEQFIQVLDGETLAEQARIGVVPPCRDGLDNDVDGLTDREDPGCLRPDDMDEGDEMPACPSPAGGSPPDPAADGCRPEADIPPCANGLDDDGDGAVDLADTDCLDRRDWSESTGALDLPAEFDLTATYPCANGVDDDGDGTADYPDDPDCFSAAWPSERGLPEAAAEVAVTGDGRWAYVAHQGLSQVSVVSLESNSLVDVSALGDSMDHRLRRRAHGYAISLAYPPSAVSFTATESALLAYVSDDGGRCSRILVEDETGPVHEADSATEDDASTTASKPELFVDGVEVQLGYSPAPGYPTLGPLLVETMDAASGTKRYYGIEFTDDLKAHRTETWRVKYEGALPDTNRLRAFVQNAGTDEEVLAVTGGSLCDVGAREGDYLTVRFDGEECGDLAADSQYNFVIENLGTDWILLAANPAWTLTPEAERSTVEVFDWTCIPQPFEFQLRTRQEFTVVGSKTGFLHTVVDGADGCRPAVDGEPLFAGRASAARLKPDADLTDCPIVGPLDELELSLFSNPMFSLNIYPACTQTPSGERDLEEIARDTLWRFAVVSGYQTQTVSVGNLPVDHFLSPEEGTLFILDTAGRSIRSLALEEFLTSVTYY